MERAKYKIVLLLLICCVVNLKGSNKSDVYSAYISNNMQLWKNVIDKMNKTSNKSTDYLLELVNYQYGYIAWCIGNNKNDEAKKYLDQAEKNITVLSQNNQYQSIVNSYRSAFYGYRIGINRILVTLLGLKSIDCAKLAIKQDKDNAFSYFQYANIEFYMPSVFGGSKSEALSYYLRAKELMEKNKEDLHEDWNYLNLLTVIAQTYSYLKDYKLSKQYLEKILIIEPRFTWVKNELYPELIKKMNN
jgi:tetratricopeptide (TPR) repeat protein